VVDPYRDVLISRLTAYKKKLKGILFQSQSVMWPETVGLRTRPSETKKSVSVLVLYTVHGLGFGLGLAGLVLCSERRSCHARHLNDLEGRSNVSSTIL